MGFVVGDRTGVNTSVEGRLAGKTAVVVGGGQLPGETVGNGKAAALLFGWAGAKVMVVDSHLERAVETVQLAAVAIAAGMRVDDLARVAVSFPTYAEVLVHAAVRAAAELGLPLGGHAAHMGITAIPA